MWLTSRIVGLFIAVFSLLLVAQAEIDETWDYGQRAVIHTPRSTHQPTAVRPTSTPDTELQKVYATAIAAATERAGRPTRTPYPTYVPTPTPGVSGDMSGRYNAYIAKVAAKLGVSDPKVTVVDYNRSELAQLAINPAVIAANPDLEAFYIPQANTIALVTNRSRSVHHKIFWHEVTHALHNMLGAPDCSHTTVRSEAESICNHNREFLYLEKVVWGAFNLIMNRNINFGTIDNCEEAIALGRQGFGRAFVRKGEIGSGIGFSIVYVSNAPDPDGDGVVCEVGGS